MSYSSVSRRRRAAARKPLPAPGGGRRVVPGGQDAGHTRATSPAQAQFPALATRQYASRDGALAEPEGRRQPLPPLPTVESSARPGREPATLSARSSSGHGTTGTLTPVRPARMDDALDERDFEPRRIEDTPTDRGFRPIPMDDRTYEDAIDEPPDSAAVASDEDFDAPFARYHRPEWPGMRRLFRRRSAFSLRERDWGGFTWIRRVRVIPGLGAMVAVLLIVGAFALVVASRAASTAGTRLLGVSAGNHNPTNAVIVQAPQPTPPVSSTAATSPYQVGVWVSNYAPGTSGAIQIFTRVSENPAPVANAQVTLLLQYGQTSSSFGPATTDADGIAVFNVTYSGATLGQPIFATVTATVGKQSATGTTTFLAGGGASTQSTASQQSPYFP